MKFSALLTSFFAVVISLWSQTTTGYIADLPQLVPQTPQAAAFSRYGEYPVSPATGIPKIDVPLYDIQSKDLHLPISISYHASGIKVEDVATPIGLGWSLNTGGVITRAIYGVADNQGYTNNHVKSVQHIGQLMQDRNVDVNYTWRKWGIAQDKDIMSDRYIFNFNGKTGVFRYNSFNNEIVSIPYSPVKIELTPNGFIIKDTDGLIYYFEGQENRYDNGALYTIAWYVTKIESQITGEVVNYKYKSGTTYKEYSRTQIARKGSRYYFGTIIVEEPFSMEERNYNSIVTYSPLLLEEISWGNNKIELIYTADRIDKYKDRLNEIKIKCGNKTIKQIIFNNNAYWGNNNKNYRMKLNSIELKGEDFNLQGEKYQFTYNEMSLPDYNRQEILGDAIYCREDYWGYYNGTATLSNFIPAEYAYLGNAANRNPSASHMQACILNEIKYPTGGSTRFEYESNRVSAAYDYNSSDAIVGGLRIKSITSITGDKQTVKTYEYDGIPTQMIRNDMFQYSQFRLYTFSCIGCGYGSPKIFDPKWEITTSVPLYSITGLSSSPVFYDTVIEYSGIPTNNNGKKVYEYRSNLRYEADFPEYPDYLYDQNLYRFWSPYYNYDQGLLSPLLISEKDYAYDGNNYSLKKEIMHDYIPVDKGEIICGVRLSYRDDWALHDGYEMQNYFPYPTIDDFFLSMEYYDLIAYRYFYLLNQTRTVEYTPNGNFTTIIGFTYDPDHRILSPVKTTVYRNGGTAMEETIDYPFHINTYPYPDMVQRNILEPMVRRTRLANGFSETIQNNYSKEGTKFVINSIQSGQTDNLETRVIFHSYDSYSNPVHLSKDNTTQIVCIWSYGGQYPVAEIRNATYSQVTGFINEATLNSISSSAEPSISAITMIANLRIQLPHAQVTTYTYKPLVGMTSKTDPNGITTYYEYDSLGRLKQVKDDNGKIMEEYNYNYIQ